MQAKKFRKVISVLVAAGIATAMYTPSFAEESFVKVLFDNDFIRVVQSSDDVGLYTVTYDKSENTMSVNVDTLDDSSDRVVYIDLNFPDKSYSISEDGDGVKDEVFDGSATRASVVQQKTFSNYEYKKTISSPNKWELRRPDPDFPLDWFYFDALETDANKSYLNTFMDYVEKINSQEADVLGKITISIFSDILVGVSGISAVFTGGTLTTAMVAAVVSSISANSLVVNSIVTLGSYWRYAYNYYFEVYERQS